MCHIQYKIKLIENGLSQKDIAQEYGCSRQWINQVINGKVKCKTTENWLNQRLGLQT